MSSHRKPGRKPGPLARLSLRHKCYLALAAVAVAGTCGQSSAHAATLPRIPARQALVTLETNHLVHAYPGSGAPVTGRVADTRPLTGSPTVLPVIATATARGVRWDEVRLPQRPDGSVGWITANGTRAGRTAWHVLIVRAQARAYIYRAGKLVRSFSIVVGAPSTPTPAGQFFIAEKVYEGWGATTGPWALATSAYSHVLRQFDGGPGQTALHGTTGLYGPLGTASSHGCMRFAPADIAWLAARVGAGTPITII